MTTVRPVVAKSVPCEPSLKSVLVGIGAIIMKTYAGNPPLFVNTTV